MEKLTNIDIASLYGLVQALTTKEPSGWARRSYYDVALALLLDEGVRVPAPKGVRQVPLIHVHPLQRRFRTATRFSQTVMNTASRKARESSPAEIHVLIKRLRNYSECKGWLDWHIEHEWREHVERFGGLLVQEEHLASIANILGRNLDELREANTMPAEEICSRPQDLHIDMYLADVLVRGIYYDEQARLTNRRVVLHPIRRAGLKGGASAVQIHYDPVVFYLLAITGNGAYEQRGSYEDKVGVWAQNFEKCRAKYDPAHKPRPGENPRDVAVSIAKTAGITRYFRWANTWADAISYFGVAAVETGLSIVIDRFFPNLPPSERTTIIEGAGLTTHRTLHEGLFYSVRVIESRKWMLSRLAEKGKRFGGRVFSHEEAEIAASGRG